MFHIVLYEPEIPPNTGNIIRLCANTGTTLSLIRPLGFELSDKRLRRAGLDYHETRDLRLYDTLDACIADRAPGSVWYFSTHGQRPHSDASFSPTDMLVFGPETRGLPAALLGAALPEQVLRIPMQADSRSMNLSNSVAVGLYEAWRQNGYDGQATPPSACDP